MTHICFVGNSHLASVKLGWEATAEQYPGLKASFFGATSDAMAYMRPAEGGYLVSQDEPVVKQLRALWGTDRFRPDDYDVLCLIGMGITAMNVGRLYRSYRSSDHRNRSGDFRLLSPDCFQAAANGLVAKRTAVKLLQLIRQTSDRPVIMTEQPARCPAPDEADDISGTWVKEMLDCGDDRALQRTFNEAVHVLPGLYRFVPQPEATKLHLFATKPEFREGARRLRQDFAGYGDDQTRHMNPAYGALLVADVCQLLAREGLLRHVVVHASAMNTYA